ncbi:FimB/Mfa2 family fimbrial subunit [Butyricimonas synergistica]|uniref:FimB/Mfa2 family fimbrial subunit n=1 Tax=Butyricimonas synergistica TaxID=544644 RepID=UPI00036B4C7B|nr:FimB/Mfa2 family fimbrial subunit [Butyricimonas synergistica]
MKKFIYIFMMLSLALGFCGCGGSGGSDGPDEPDVPDTPEGGPAKVEFALKSGINSLDDAGLKGIISHVRLFVFDQSGKLKNSYKYNSVAEIKSVEMDEGSYTVAFVGNVPDDANISGNTVGTALADMKIQLTRKDGAANFTPLGDVLFAQNTLTVGGEDTKVELTVKRTLSTTKVQVTDYSGKITEAGVLVPNVGTTLAFGDTEWKEPGTVFVTMTKGGLARADSEDKNYSVTMNIAVVNEGSGAGKDNNIQCNIIARDESQEVVLAQVVNVVAETKPDTEVSMSVEVKESASGDGQLESTVNKVETKDETGKTEELPKDKVEVKETDVTIEVFPGDWQTGNTEDVEIGEREDFVRPGGMESNWDDGNKEEIVIGD